MGLVGGFPGLDRGVGRAYIAAALALAEAVGVTGQTVVERMTVSVTTVMLEAGQDDTVDGQAVMVRSTVA